MAVRDPPSTNTFHRLPAKRTASLFYMRFVLVPEMLERTRNWRNFSITKRTNRLSFDIPTQSEEKIKVFDFALPCLHATQNLHEPHTAFTAWRTLSARFVMKKLEEPLGRPNHTGIFMHKGDRA